MPATDLAMTELIPLLTYSLVMSITPGPNNIMLTASGANFGYRRSLPQILGVSAAQVPQVFLACLGLGAAFQAWPVLHQTLRIAGAVYLVVLAWKLAGSAVGRKDMERPLSFWQGMSFQLLNPKGWVKAITVATVFMPPGLGLLAGSALVTVISIAINLPCTSMWALFGVAIRQLLTRPFHRKLFNAMMASSLVVLAITLML